MSVQNSGRQQLEDEFVEVGGENVVKMHANDAVLNLRKNEKKHVFWEKYGKIGFWCLFDG